MFCKNCGMEIQEEWKMCPNCGNALKADQSAAGIEKKYVDDEQKKRKKTREEIKDELNNKMFLQEGGVVLWYGSGAISRDLEKLLRPGEDVKCFYHAYRSSLLGAVKSSNVRMFREYMVCTDQRLIYYETGRTTLSLVPLLKKFLFE